MEDVLLVSELRDNLMSVKKLASAGVEVTFSGSVALLKKEGKVIATAQMRGGLSKTITRAIKKAVVAGSLDEVRSKAAEKFNRPELPNIHLDSDGTEVDDEDYFQTLEPNAELIVVFPGEQWIDMSAISTRCRHRSDQTVA
nr:cell death activator CIDE-B-like [Aedes albopictus]